MTLREQIIQQAMSLSPEDREYVADLLEGSLPTGEFASQDVAEAWSVEIDRRIAAYDRRETTAVDVETALENMRHALDVHRAGKNAQ